MAKLELYHAMDCPFSRKVRDYIDANGLRSRIAYHDVETEAGALERLMRLTGDPQVPCLVVDDQPLLESDSIIEWLDEHPDVTRAA